MSLKIGVLDKVIYFNREGQVIQWIDCASIEKEYWSAVFNNLQLYKYKFIITENYESLPEYGNHIVVILKSDEFVSRVEYVSKVKAIFRNYFDSKYLSYPNVFFLPLPYLGQLNATRRVPILDRDIDIFFAGQIAHDDRRRLSEIISRLHIEKGDLNIVFYKTNDFFTGWDIKTYLKHLEQSKISLCPRGASVETYRHFESLRQGCVLNSSLKRTAPL